MLSTLVRAAGLYGLAMVSVLVRRTAATMCLYGVVVALSAVGLGFLTVAAFLALMEGLGAVVASLIVGCAYLVGALVALLAAQARRRR